MLFSRSKVGEIKRSQLLGFSLLELVISVFLTTLLLSALVQHFLIAKKQYTKAETLLNQVFEEQLVESVIRNSIHSAGFTPCLPLDRLISRDTQTSKPLVAIEIKHDPQGNAQLKIGRMNNTFSSIHAISDSKLVLITHPIFLKPGQRVLIADCYHAEVHQVQALYRINAKYAVRLKTPLCFHYDKNEAYLGDWVEETFFVQKNRRGKPALFYRREHTEELIPGVKAFDVQWIFVDKDPLIQVKLSKRQGKDILLETGVRAG